MRWRPWPRGGVMHRGILTLAGLAALASGCIGLVDLNGGPGTDSGTDTAVEDRADTAVTDTGVDVPGCSGGRMSCGGTCTDVMSDPNNCGRCGNVCHLAHATATCSH